MSGYFASSLVAADWRLKIQRQSSVSNLYSNNGIACQRIRCSGMYKYFCWILSDIHGTNKRMSVSEPRMEKHTVSLGLAFF